MGPSPLPMYITDISDAAEGNLITTRERGYIETGKCKGKHAGIGVLKATPNFQNDYIWKTDIPEFPKAVEFHITSLSHVTGRSGLDGVLHDGGFKKTSGSGNRTFLWWSLEITKEDRDAAEQRFLESLFPDRTPEQAERQEPFLHKFTTSLAFLQSSRYGNFRFTFPLQDLLQEYKTQICNGEEPVLRVYETVCFKQEIVYAVVVHSPGVHDFDDYPPLEKNEHAICGYQDGKIIWRPEAMSETHWYYLDQSDRNTVKAVNMTTHQFYVWDHVALAFHVKPGQILSFDRERLGCSLSACEAGKIKINKPWEFVRYDEAAQKVAAIKALK
ncbi:uncharacterized protein LOC136714101 [Amia ocellicauda]|uniref:uncharacterized protein LOC136714101 n=1 Tax=Amia ocellicauda TaxID=2972642 RepID=UPI003463B9F1